MISPKALKAATSTLHLPFLHKVTTRDEVQDCKWHRDLNFLNPFGLTNLFSFLFSQTFSGINQTEFVLVLQETSPQS